jgi:hypothetical protein
MIVNIGTKFAPSPSIGIDCQIGTGQIGAVAIRDGSSLLDILVVQSSLQMRCTGIH